MDIPAYFDRIRYAGSVRPGARSLRALHRHHMLTVPFENLDIGLGRKIVLDTELFIEKVVKRRRGGFCYELNGAFATLLAALGFRVHLLSARVADRNGVPSREFDHLTLYVESGRARSRVSGINSHPVEESWLADVGFGDNFLEPLRFGNGVEQRDPAGCFRLVQTPERWRLERRNQEAAWRLQYDFLLKPRRLAEFAGMCRYHQTSRDSHFTRNRICSLATPDGRITLSGMRLIVRSNATREETTLETEAELRSALHRHFGIVLDRAPGTPGKRRPGARWSAGQRHNPPILRVVP